MQRICMLGLLLAVLLNSGCDKPAQTPAVVDLMPSEPTQAQARLRTVKLWVGRIEVTAEIALTDQEQRTGMMFRTERLPEDGGMLFPLPYTQRASFWMKNCPLPLSAAYIDEAGVIQEVRELQANNTNSVTAASDKIRFVLEESEGWFTRHQVKPGVAVATERGPLMKTFFAGR